MVKKVTESQQKNNMTPIVEDIKWSLDSFMLKDGNLFSYGWCACSTQNILVLEMILTFNGGTVEVLTTNYGINRGDLKKNLSTLTPYCGFFIYTAVCEKGMLNRIQLRAKLADENQIIIECPLPASELTEQGFRFGMQQRMLINYSARALKMLWRGQWKAVWHRTKEFRKSLFSRFRKESHLDMALSELLPNGVLIIDHNLGGGANRFSAERVEHHIGVGRNVILWVFTPYLLQHEITIHDAVKGDIKRFHFSWEKWKVILASQKFNQVELNNCVGFPDQVNIPDMLIAFKQVGGVHLIVYLHDFHLVCPSHFLINHRGVFCGVPEIGECHKCLPRINNGLANLFVQRDINLWRQKWGSMLNVADEVVYFSKSSREFLLRAYPNINEHPLIFRPHTIPKPDSWFTYPKNQAGLKIAVVGQIGPHKGSDVVLNLLRESTLLGVELEVVVVGTIETREISEHLIQTGPYQVTDLAYLLNKHLVHFALMPSIWPETFSYVTHELIELNVPILTFNFGAQAEAMANYSLGRVVPLEAPRELLTHLLTFKDYLDKHMESCPVVQKSDS